MKAIKVLVVEDDVEDAELLLEALLKVNVTDIYVVSNVPDAISYLLNEEHALPCVIISDNSLPKISGVEFAEKLQTIAAYKHIPFILMSSHIRPDEIARVTKMEPVSFFAKPYDYKGYATIAFQIKHHCQFDDPV